MLTLKSLTFSGIGRFVEEQTIDFTQLGSLIQVEGKNNNTGGSSGAGKSTLFKSLDFLLGLNDLSNSVLQSRLTKTPMSVTGLFDFDGLPLKIERGKKLLIDLNGEVTTGSSKLTEEKLDQIIGMSRDLFRKVMHKRQGEGGFFLDMGPTDVHKFLTNCLGLEKEQNKVTTLDTRLSALLEVELSLKSQIGLITGGIDATAAAILALGPGPVLEIDPESLEALKRAYEEAVKVYKLIKESYKKEMEDLEASRPQIQIAPFDRSGIEFVESEVGIFLAQIAKLEKVELERQSQVKAKISELQITIGNLNNKEIQRVSDLKNQILSLKAEISKIESTEKERQSTVQQQISNLKIQLINVQSKVDQGSKAMDDAAALAKELQKVRSSVCPTCEQGWITDSCKAKEAQILAKLSEYKKTVIAGNEAKNSVTLINQQLEGLKSESAPKVTLEVDQINAKINELAKDSYLRPVPGALELARQIQDLQIESEPQAIREVIEIKLKTSNLNNQLSELRKQESDHQFKENAKQQLIVVNFAQKQTALRQQHQEALGILQDAENFSLARYSEAKHKVQSFQEAWARFSESLNKLQTQLSGYSGQLEAKNRELTSVLEETELANESKKCIKSYLSCSFEDALDSIGDMATKLIRTIPNMSTATIQFEGLKETKEGKIKEEVVCLVSMDGEIGIPIKSLSGGERSSTDLAIDLSVIKFIEERTNSGIKLMLLDEPFTGLDTKNILEALEMLKEYSVDKQLMITDHNQEASQFVESRLIVIRDGLTSRIENL